MPAIRFCTRSALLLGVVLWLANAAVLQLTRVRATAAAHAEGGASIYDAPVPGLALGSTTSAPIVETDYEKLKK